MISTCSTLLLLCTILVLLPTEAYAFGAGEIPDFAYLNDKAFRHGDIENVLAELAKTAAGGAGAAAGGSLFGFAQSLIGAATGGSNFSKEDVKKVYFGNWLRDYSQAMDIAGLSKLTADTLVLIVSVLGFLTFGFATEEYEVTADRLSVYLPVEHIDNPKGYAEQEGDARRFHPKLRPPVNPEELDIDRRTGMKNYMATEGRGWDTSTAHIRRTFKACIAYGRRAQGREGADLWEAFRLLGTGLHTMEDLLAHSNWCEIALRKMGHEQVFCHVGENVIIRTPNGSAPPLVTGTFGSADFLHSLMGEATDHLSQASVVDLSANLTNAAQSGGDSSLLRSLLEKLPLGGSHDEDRVEQADAMQEQAKAYQFNPDNIMPPEVQRQLLQLLRWRDDIYRDILKKIEMIPGLESLIDALTNALNAFVYTILAPYLTPVLQQVTAVLGEGSKAVIDSEDQYEVFDNPDASDPSHSLLSKDHFSLILNEPAGKTALVVVRYAVGLVVDAWYNHDTSPDRVVDRILEAFHHPYFSDSRSRVQREMFEEMERWAAGLGTDAERVLAALSKESVRGGKNKRQDSDDDLASSDKVYGQTVQGQGGYASAAEARSYGSGRPQQQGYGGESEQSYGATGGAHDASQNRYSPSASYSGAGGGHPSRNPSYSGQPAGGEAHGSRRRTEEAAYSGGLVYDASSQRRTGYEGGGSNGSGPAYGGDDAYGRGGYGGGASRGGDDGYDRGSYGQDASYGTEPPAQSRYAPSYQPAYAQPSEGYGSRDDYGSSRDDSGVRRGAYAAQEQEPEYAPRRSEGYGSSGYRRDNADYAREEGEDTGFGSHANESSGYGGRGGYQDEGYGARSGEEYGGRRDEGYGGGYDGGERRSGYGEDDGGRSYGRQQQQESAGYGGGYGESRGYGGGAEGERRGGYSGGSYGGGSSESASRGYGGGGYGRDETFGAERLSLQDDDDDAGERPNHHHHHRHHRREEDE